jgi:poly(glycerol-phosphate) alpha-glucosyltransferase
MVVLEAWVNSKPVIMTPQCNLPQGFATGAALRVEPEVESIAEGLGNFFGMSDSQQTEMGLKARALAAERFVWPKIAEQMKTVYEWMLGGGPKPASIADF